VTSAIVFGGTSSVSDDVASQVGTLAALGGVAAAAQVSAAYTGRYGSLDATVNGTEMDQVVDGTTGDVTTYQASAASTSGTGPTLSQLQAVPVGAGLVAAVNALYASSGLTATDPNQLFLLNAAKLVLNPITPPTLRLATYGVLASLTETAVSSGVKDATGRVGAEISAPAVNGGSAASTGSISWYLDPATGLPLEVSTVLGAVTTTTVVKTVTTSNTVPTSPFTS
jgi:hypothetical protein